MTADQAHTPCCGRAGRSLQAIRVLGLAVAALVAWTDGAAAFPLLDATNLDQVPQGTELATPEVQDLQQQLRLVNGLAAPAGGGWTFVPRIDWQEELTDNAYQVHSPRRADLVTFISPGISIAGDLPRIQMTFDFAPTLAVYGRSGNLNALTEQLNGLASITLVPDLAYVDVRALSGVHNQYGGIGGLGSVGTPAGAAATAQTAVPDLAGNGYGLNKNNEVQVTSVGISPYLLRRFGDWGTGKLGYSLDVTQSNSLSGFAAQPFPTGGANAQTLISNEEIAHFDTGDFMEMVQNSFDVDLLQNQSTSNAGVIDAQTGTPSQTKANFTSTRDTISDRINYQVSHGLSVFALGGHEDIVYSDVGVSPIHDLIWSLGTTWTPSPDSSISLSYGHQNGFNSFTANGYYAVTARTSLTVSYGSTLGTQLENIQNQFALAGANGSGTLVNGRTGGQLFSATNALGVQEGVFRTSTLTVGSQTVLDRDIIAVNLLMAKQTSVGSNFSSTASTAQSKSANVTWLHQMRPDMTFSAAVAYAIQDQSTGALSTFNPGDNTSIAATLAWQWQLSDTVSTSVRYSFFERHAAASGFDLVQNILILGISKRF